MTQPIPDPGSELQPRIFSKPDSAARRQRMRDFQNRLVDRMQAARGGTDTRASQLGVQIGDTRWLFDLQQAGEIVAVESITGVPLTQPWFLGLTNIRGNLISVVDFARFLGSASTIIDKQSRIVAFAPGLAFNGGLLVSRVLGLRNLADMTPEEAPDLASSAAAPAPVAEGTDRRARVRRYVDRDHDVWQVLDLIALTQDPQFLHVAA